MSKADSGIHDRSKARAFLKRLHDDPIFFVQQIWLDRKLNSVAPLGDVELDMVDYAFNGPRRRGVLGARGIGKTTLLTGCLTVYRGFRDHDRKILIVSKSATAAKETIGLTREWLDRIWFLQHLAPRKGKSSDTTNYYDFGTAKSGISKQPSVKALGNDGQLEGNRAHTVIPDDAETKGNTKTQTARDELRRTFSEFRNVLYPNRDPAKGGPIDPTEIVVVGTYKHEDSVYKGCAERGYAIRTYPLVFPMKTDKLLNLAPILQHKLDSGEAEYTTNGQYQLQPVYPHRFGEQDILEKMAEGKHEFAMEHLLASNLSDAQRYPLKLADLIVHDCPRNSAPITVTWGSRNNYGETVFKGAPCLGMSGDRLHFPMALDRVLMPYATTKACLDIAGSGNDRTGLAIAGYLNGNFWVKHCKGHQGGADEITLQSIAMTLRQHDAREVWVETNIDIFDTYAQSLEVQIRRLKLLPNQDPAIPEGWSCSVQTFRSHGAIKEDRICNVLQPVLGSHRIIVDPSVVRPGQDEADFQTFQYQLSRIQRMRKCLREDGAIDALASLILKFQQSTSGVRTDPEAQRVGKEMRQARELLARKMRNDGIEPGPARTFSHH